METTVLFVKKLVSQPQNVSRNESRDVNCISSNINEEQAV